MDQGGGQKQTKLSQQQQDILLWLAKQEGRIKPTRILSPYGVSWASFMDAVEAERARLALVSDGINRAIREQTERLYWSLGLTSPDPPAPALPVKLGTRWSPELYLNRTPTDSERVSLSKSLKRLEQQGLIKRTANRGKRKRTTHLKLTVRGIEIVDELLAANNLKAG